MNKTTSIHHVESIMRNYLCKEKKAPFAIKKRQIALPHETLFQVTTPPEDETCVQYPLIPFVVGLPPSF